jgi:hypothetical protein
MRTRPPWAPRSPGRSIRRRQGRSRSPCRVREEACFFAVSGARAKLQRIMGHIGMVMARNDAKRPGNDAYAMNATWRFVRDLSVVRLAIVLVCVPLPVAVFLAFVGGRFNHMPRTFLLWFILTFLLYLLAARFVRGKLSRNSCLIVGALAGMTWQYALLAIYAWLPSSIADWLGYPQLTADPAELLVAYFATWQKPVANGAMWWGIGGVAGWLVWHFGVRPAPPPFPEEISDVFA